MLKLFTYYLSLITKFLSIFTLILLLINSLEYTFIYRLPEGIIKYIPKGILMMPFGTQVILILVLLITLLTAFSSKTKHPIIWGLLGVLSASGISLTVSLSKFFATNQEGAIVFKFVKIIKRFSPEYKYSEYMLTFNKTLQEQIELHRDILDYKQRILNAAVKQFPNLKTFENMSLEEVRRSANDLLDTISKKVMENHSSYIEMNQNNLMDLLLGIGIVTILGLIFYYFLSNNTSQRVGVLEHNDRVIMGYVRDIYKKTMNNEQAIGVLTCFGIPTALQKINSPHAEILSAMFKGMGLSVLTEENKRLFDVLLHANIKYPNFTFVSDTKSTEKPILFSNRIYGFMKPKEVPTGFVPFSGEGRSLGSNTYNIDYDK